jgi:hypothetical protein
MESLPDMIMDLEIEKYFPAANEIRKRISNTELAIKYTKHTVRLKQNKKKLNNLHNELNRTIFNHNKFNLFNYMDELISKELEKRIPEQFNEFTTVNDIII